MKTRILKTGIGSLIFIFLIFCIAALLQPVYKRITQAVSDKAESFRAEVELRTGLTFSYDSLSPSILSAFNIKGIVVSDVETGKKIVSIRKLVLTYDLFKMLDGDFSDSLVNLLLNGVTVEYDAVANKSVRERLATLAGSTGVKKSADDEAATDSVTVSNSAMSLANFLPFSVQVKNTSVHYKDASLDAMLRIKNAGIKKNQAYGITVDADGDGRMSVGAKTKLLFGFATRGTVSYELSGSTLRLYLNNLASDTMSVRRLGLLVNYDDDTLGVKTIDSAYPMYAELASKLKTGKNHFVVKTERFLPFQFVTFKQIPEQLKKFQKTPVTLSADGDFDLKQKKLSYAVSGDLPLDSGIIPGGARLSGVFSGTADSVTVKSASLIGRDYDIRYSGTYNIRTMQPQGTAEIRKLVLKNGAVITADAYFDALSKGFQCFIPQLFFDDRAYTALQLTVIPQKESVDFSFEGYDFSHAESGEPGLVKIDGSYLSDTKYLQAGVSVSNMYLDSVLGTAAYAAKGQNKALFEKLMPSASPYVFTGDLFMSTDFHSVSYNVPYSIVANTTKDREFVVFALDGNNSSFQISRLNLVYGSAAVSMTAMADVIPETGEVFFSNDVTVNDVPYKFTGTVSNTWIDISGDYGFRASASFNPSPANVLTPYLSGSVRVEELPVALKKYIFTTSADVSFFASESEGVSCTISRFEVQEPTGKFIASPKMSFTGNLNKYGFIIDTFAYSDSLSALDGQGSILWNINDSLFDSANVEFTASSLLSQESWSISGTVTNPDRKAFSLDALKKDFYFSWQADFKNFISGRLMKGQSSDDALTLSATLNGTLENPYVACNLERSSVSMLGAPAVFYGSAVLEDGVLHLADINAQWLMLKLADLNLDYTVSTASCVASANINAAVMNQTVDIPLDLRFDTISKSSSSGLPESYLVKLSSENMSGSLFSAPVSVSFDILRTPGRYDIYSEGNMTVSGYVLDDGVLDIRTGPGFPVQAYVAGYMRSDGINLQISDINAELGDFSQLVAFPFFTVYKGKVSGGFSITGLASDPEFNGTVYISEPDFNLPMIIPDHFKTERMVLSISGSDAVMEPTRFIVADTPVNADLSISFDRWNFMELAIGVKTDPGVYVPANVDLGDIKVTGQGSPSMKISIMPDHAEVSGRILAKNTNVVISTKVIQQAVEMAQQMQQAQQDGVFSFNTARQQGYGLYVALDILMGQKVQLLLDPLLRGVAVPNTELSLRFDMLENKVLINSDITFRGGEIFYLNRNFYMKEGRIVFSDAQDTIDPIITVRAETKERDANGNQVTVVLSARNEPASRFHPMFSAVPAKSENEIMELLGQVISGDSKNFGSLVVSGGDLLLQSTVMRKVENTLRDLFNFDIFSIRTMVLQNAMKQSLRLNSESDRTNSVTFGNFFDNSTVYIGKYFSSELYTDALLHWTYDKNRINDDTTTGGLVFQPEIGLELDSPYVKIRWSIDPDMDSIRNNLWIPTAAVTLSWKFSF